MADHYEVAVLLVINGANVEASDSEGLSCLKAACYNDSMKIAKLLLNHGADVNRGNDKGLRCC